MTLPLPPAFTSGRLGEKIERLLERALTKLYNVLVEPISTRVRGGVDRFLEEMEQTALNYVRPVIGRVKDESDLPPEWKALLDRVYNPQSQLEIGAVLGVAIALLIGIIQGAVAPVGRLVSYFVERIVQSGRPDPLALWAMFRRGSLDVAQRDSYLDDLGVSDRLKTAFGVASEVRPGVGELATLWLRGHLDTGAFHARLQQEGVSSEFISDIERLAEQIPGPSDLVRFALREAWRDDIAQKYGYDADYVAEFGEWMERLGYSADWAKKYWRAHWELPSITLGMEMVHRRIISEDEFKDLLRVADIPQGWRDKLAQVIYSPYTRVDARRMHALGVLGDEDLVGVYMDQGYDREHAENMAEFTIRYNQQENRELTKTDILNGYRDGILTHDEASVMLVSINFSQETASFLLARVDSRQAQKLTDAEVRVLKDLFLNGDLTTTEMQQRLTALGLPSRQIELYVAEWTIDREGKVKRPSRATLERLYKSGAIGLDDFTGTMAAIGYQTKYIEWYLRNITLEREAEAEKEEERARKERERVEADRRKTRYQRAKAEIDVEIAEVNAAIAASEVALVEAQNDKAEALRAALPLERRAQIERDYMVVIHDADAALGEARVAVAGLREDERELRTRLAEIDQSLAANVDIAEQSEIKAAIASMRVEQARFRDAVAALQVEIAEKKVVIEKETDADKQVALKVELLELEVAVAEEKQAVTDVEIDIKEAQERLGETMAEVRRQELRIEQTDIRVDLADVAERIASTQAEMAETQTAKTDARNAMEAELTALPGAVQELGIRKKFDTLIEDIKARIKELRVKLSQLRVRKALLTFEYKGITD